MPRKIQQKKDNPNGLHQRYKIQREDGNPVDPDAIYFVLRLDKRCKDQVWAEACRNAVFWMTEHLHKRPIKAKHLFKLADEMRDLVVDLEMQDA